MDEKATVSLIIAGWTYSVSFPTKQHDQESIVCSGLAHIVVDEDDEVIEKELYLEIMRESAAGQKSTYLIKDDGIDVSVYVSRDDFGRIVQELKDQSRHEVAVASIEFEGLRDQGKVHEFASFQLTLAVDGGTNG
jgi:hypothetical protein